MLAKFLGRFSTRSEPEKNSGIPVAVDTPVKPLSIHEIIQKYVREELSPRAVEEGSESFEDADDFEPAQDEDIIPLTHHQVVAMTDDEIRGVASSYGIELKDSTAQEAAGAPIAPPPGTLGTPQMAPVPPGPTQAPQAG